MDMFKYECCMLYHGYEEKKESTFEVLYMYQEINNINLINHLSLVFQVHAKNVTNSVAKAVKTTKQ